MILHMGGAAGEFFFELEAGCFEVKIVRRRYGARWDGEYYKSNAAGRGEMASTPVTPYHRQPRGRLYLFHGRTFKKILSCFV